MKLQYYLRGLGIGILVTAMIFCILPGEKESLTDEEIRARAVQLGMVESSSLTLADVQNKQQEQKETLPSEVPQESQEIIPESTEAPQKSAEIMSENTEASRESAEEIPEKSETSQKSAEVIPERTAQPEVLKITIQGGSGSYTVSKLLEENLLIEDAGEFDKYLINNGYSRKIRVGTHEIPMGATWEEIADIISGK